MWICKVLEVKTATWEIVLAGMKKTMFRKALVMI